MTNVDGVEIPGSDEVSKGGSWTLVAAMFVHPHAANTELSTTALLHEKPSKFAWRQPLHRPFHFHGDIEESRSVTPIRIQRRTRVVLETGLS